MISKYVYKFTQDSDTVPSSWFVVKWIDQADPTCSGYYGDPKYSDRMVPFSNYFEAVCAMVSLRDRYTVSLVEWKLEYPEKFQVENTGFISR
jgi:hypothetical protein